MLRARQIATAGLNPAAIASTPPAVAGGLLCKLFPNAPRCQEIAAPCPPGHEPCGTFPSGDQRCCPSGAPAPTPSRTFMLPSGKRGRVRPHRTFKTSSGRVTFNPNVAKVTTRYIKQWVPAYAGQPALGSRGSWLQLPKDGRPVGLLHTPGLRVREVAVLGTRGNYALIRRPSDRAVNPAYTSIVSTRRRQRRTSRVTAPTQDTRSLWCKLFPGSARCGPSDIAACPPGTTNYPGDPSKCIPDEPMGQQNGGVTTRVRRRGTVRANPQQVNVTQQATTTQGGMVRLGQALRALGRGDARLVVDRGGISITNPQFPGSCAA